MVLCKPIYKRSPSGQLLASFGGKWVCIFCNSDDCYREIIDEAEPLNYHGGIN